MTGASSGIAERSRVPDGPFVGAEPTARPSMSHVPPRGLRVLLIASAYPRSPGDVITPWLVQSIHHLAAAGVETEVLAPAYRGSGEQVVDGVRVHRFRYAPRAWERLTHDQTAPDRIRAQPRYLALVPSYVASAAAAAARLAASGRFDLVHALWPLPHAIPGLVAKRAGRIPLVCTFFGVELRWLASGTTPIRPLLRAVVARSDVVTAISAATAAQLRALVPGVDVETIPFGAAIDGRSAADGVGTRRLRAENDALNLLFVGRLVERKGVHVLLDAVAALVRGSEVGARISLDVVGDGAERASLEARARALGVLDRVRFRGVVSTEALQGFMRGCDALVLPALVDGKGDTEGLGVVLLEALSHGKPVIASATGGITDIVRDGETGYLVPPGDHAALARRIEALSNDPVQGRVLAEAGCRFVQSEFSWATIVDRLVRTYAGAVARREGRPS